MISKDIAVKKMLAKGYKARLENGVVYVLYENQEEYKQLSKTVKKDLLEMEYSGSFGIKFDANFKLSQVDI